MVCAPGKSRSNVRSSLTRAHDRAGVGARVGADTVAGRGMGRKLEASLAILNGAIGDYLARTGNGLATEMTLVAKIGDDDAVSARTGGALARPAGAVARGSRSLSHGLMCTETIWEMADGTDYGTRLARDLGLHARSTFATTRDSRSPKAALSSRRRSRRWSPTYPGPSRRSFRSGTAWAASSCGAPAMPHGWGSEPGSRGCAARSTSARRISALPSSAWAGRWRRCCARSTIRTRGSWARSPTFAATA